MSTTHERFWSKVDKTEGCWLWTASLIHHGYGWFNRGSRGAGVALAHRWAYEEFVGPIPDGMVIDHLCRVRHCVRPDHLRVVTPAVNVLTGETLASAKKAQTHCVHGHSLADAYVRKNGTRLCRPCQLAAVARRKAARREIPESTVDRPDT